MSQQKFLFITVQTLCDVVTGT